MPANSACRKMKTSFIKIKSVCLRDLQPLHEVKGQVQIGTLSLVVRSCCGFLLQSADNPGIGVTLQGRITHLPADATLLHAPKRHIRGQVEMLIDPDRARFNLTRHFDT